MKMMRFFYPFLFPSQGELLSHMRKEQQQQQHRYEHHLRTASAESHKFGPPLGPAAYPPLGAVYPPRDEPTNQGLRRSPFPPLHTRVGGLPGSAAPSAYGPYGGGLGSASPRLPFPPPPKEATPPKQLLSPLDKATISNIAR
jgi:hypothetical protein